MLEINWDITFSYLNVSEKLELFFKTNTHLSKQKRIKVQRLIEEIPTIEQLKKSSFDLYRGLLCPFCNHKKETFFHMWTCQNNRGIFKLELQSV